MAEKARDAVLVAPVPSPCVNVCRMDEVSGLCEGCLRTIDEIAAWGQLDDDAKRAVWARLAPRRVARAAADARPGGQGEPGRKVGNGGKGMP